MTINELCALHLEARRLAKASNDLQLLAWQLQDRLLGQSVEDEIQAAAAAAEKYRRAKRRYRWERGERRPGPLPWM